MKLTEITPRVLEKYYHDLLGETAAPKASDRKYEKNERKVTRYTIKRINTVLKSCFHQAMKGELMEKNPATLTSLSKTVAEMLVEWKKEQNAMKARLGDEYHDFQLVFAGSIGLPTESSDINSKFRRLIEENDLPKVVFHNLRHSSITYKLKLNGGDVKSVQGDSGHAQAKMVTDQYSHILDDDRMKNAEIFGEVFYSGKEEPARKAEMKETSSSGDEAAMIAKLLSNPETANLLKALVKAMDGNNG